MPKNFIAFILGRNLPLSLGRTDFTPGHAPSCDFGVSILPFFCLAKISKIRKKKIKNLKNIKFLVELNEQTFKLLALTIHLRLSEDVNDFLLVLLIVNCACLNVHLASLIVDRCSCLFVDTIERL